MKRKNYKLLVCALTMANFGFLGFNNCSAASSIEPNVTENHPVMENIISSEKMTKDEVNEKVDETMENAVINTKVESDKNITVQATPDKQDNAEVKDSKDKVHDEAAIAKMNQWKEQRPAEETIKDSVSAYAEKTIVSVDVVGTDIIPKEDVLSVLKIKAGDKFDMKNIEQDRSAIYNMGYFYDNYPSFEVVPEGVKVTYHVMENPVLRSVEITGNRVYSTEQIKSMLNVKTGEILNLRQLNIDLANIETVYRQNGYILAKLKDISIDESGNLSLQFNEGILEGYAVKGNDKTKDYVITREMRMKPGEVFNSEKARRSMQRVYNLGFFEDVSVKLLPGQQDPDNIIMELTVVEKRTGSFGIGAGYSSQDGLLGMVRCMNLVAMMEMTVVTVLLIQNHGLMKKKQVEHSVFIIVDMNMMIIIMTVMKLKHIIKRMKDMNSILAVQ